MEFNNLTLNLNNISKIENKNIKNHKINFKGNDVVNFSDGAKKKAEIISQLKNIGLSSLEINNLMKKYYGTEQYWELINGNIADDEQTYAHYAPVDRNLTPTEAIVYQAYDMENYFMQYWDLIPNEPSNSNYRDYDIGQADFTPLDLAKTINEGYNIVLAGMILKNKININDAQKIQEYNEILENVYNKNLDIKETEYLINAVIENIDKLNELTDDKKTQELGLLRPLDKEEAFLLLIDCDYLPKDTESLNHYFEVNTKFGFSLPGMDLYGLWDKSIEEIEESLRPKNITKLKTKLHFENLQDKIQYSMKKNEGKYSEFYEDIMQLDSDKFFKLLPLKTINFNAQLYGITGNLHRDLRQKNIQVLNSMSNELLNKMTTNKEGKKTALDLFGQFLYISDLDEKTMELENLKETSPKIFNSMSQAQILDYLTNSDFYSNNEETHDYFAYTMENGHYHAPYNETKKSQIIDFKKDE